MDHLAQQALKTTAGMQQTGRMGPPPHNRHLIRNDINQAYHQTIIEQLKAKIPG